MICEIFVYMERNIKLKIISLKKGGHMSFEISQ